MWLQHQQATNTATQKDVQVCTDTATQLHVHLSVRLAIQQPLCVYDHCVATPYVYDHVHHPLS